MLLTANELMHRPLRARGGVVTFWPMRDLWQLEDVASYVSTMNVLANNIAGQFQQTSS